MILLSKFPNFPDELNENDQLREYELSGSDCNGSVADLGGHAPSSALVKTSKKKMAQPPILQVM